MTTTLARYQPVIDIDDAPHLSPVTPSPAHPLTPWIHAEPSPDLPFGALYAYTYGEHERRTWEGMWEEAVERWLHSGRRRSPETRRSYRHAVLEFRRYLREQRGIYNLWQIEDHTCAGWIAHMRTVGELSDRTVAARIAALSSLYSYAANTRTVLSGREISLFVDAYGSVRANPFLGSAVQRPKVEQFSDVTAVPSDAYAWIISSLQDKPKPTVANRRNLAILLAFGLNGWRNQEVLVMTWGKINPNSQRKGEYTYAWTGKARDGQVEKRSLPAPIYDAIVAYLKADDRWNPGGPGHIDDDDYIWQPLRTEGCNNFTNAGALVANRHITQSTCNEILRSQLTRYYRHLASSAGLDRSAAAAYAREQAARYSIHSLRHMFAWNLYEATGHDLHMVSQKVGHKSIATTQIYLQHLKEPQDDHSALLAKQLGLNL
jgi:integrase